MWKWLSRLAFLALVVVSALTLIAADVRKKPDSPPSETPCGEHLHRHTVVEHNALTKKAFVNYRINESHIKTHKHMVKCAVHPEAEEEMRSAWSKAQEQYRKRFKWRIRYDAMSASDKQWAHNIAICESTMNRHAHNGNHHSYFQWLPSTWAAAGGKGHPEDSADYYEQAVIAVHWRNVEGASQWACVG